jgi:hypothetical protein
MGLQLILAGVSSWVGGRFNWVSNFYVRVAWLAVEGTEMLTVYVVRGQDVWYAVVWGFFLQSGQIPSP